MTAGQARPTVAANQVAALEPPYRTALKPYGRALVELARRRPEIVCLSGDLTRQCEIDLFQAEIPDRFIHAGMAEANMMGVAGALARSGHIPFVHTFGVFATRRPLDQIINAIAYPPGPVYLRLKRGEIPVIFPASHQFSLDHAQLLTEGTDVALLASGMMLAPTLAAAKHLNDHGVSVSVVNVPVIK